MQRQSFFRRLFSGVAAVLFGKAKTTVVASAYSYYFDWTKDPPYTDDPRYAGILAYGKHNRVYLDGVDIGDAMRFRTGSDGFIERRNDKAYLGREILRGDVRYVDQRGTTTERKV